ncbi:stage III sporulation protein AG [Thermaerobacter sp. PB12/4term]|uniref:stage III sporulation protein AG n=1 Tax=Thermaerobacter sp. PB12/4term TaxID=2293838 RepID=UPI000E328C67|nr:stage III sporulation protein AG [Thermaerobacter sp. PB12/4term]QIA27108.1 stage III sporulation protein AG [Thermaerobacter sp. PB12/4term]
MAVAQGDGRRPALALALDWRDPRRRQQLLLAAALMVGVGLLVAGQWRQGGAGPAPAVAPAPTVTASATAAATNPLQPMAADLAARLEAILSGVQGAGRVQVEVHLARGPRYEYAANQVATERRIEEQDSGGGRRTTTEQRDERQLLRGGGDEPALISEVDAVEIAGVLVVAEGAADPDVRAALTQAVATYLHLPLHRVMVLAGQPRP